MTWVDDLTTETEETLNTEWDVRNGNVVPEAEDVALADGAVKIEATFLYADLASSSKIAQVCPWQTTAKIIRGYLKICTRLIRAYGGHIRSFDGDRVMGVFLKDDLQNTHATYCAREIDWCVENILHPKAHAKFNSIKNNNIRITHCIGIDTGETVAVRAGIRDNNDLIWIGTAPSFAAKLSDIRNYPYSVYISSRSYNKLHADAKMDSGKDIWEARSLNVGSFSETGYRTKHLKTP